ncbi:MAG: nitrous oxide reductase family maturation protein NosD [Alphaproteobacteria bacterium]|nr:MAG: nitrous oxide reductase family maturation protein NosD [Alphaproteobacteria bacterium]
MKRIAAAGFALAVALAALPAFADDERALAGEHIVGAGELATALKSVAPGERLRLLPGRYRGRFTVGTPDLVITGEVGAILDGGGQGRVLTIDAPGVTVRGLIVIGSGASLEHEDAGIFLTRQATAARIVGNHLADNLIGIDVKGARDALVADNLIEGRTYPHMNERGNGVQVWNAPGTRIVHNEILLGRDGIFVTTSKRNLFAFNRIHDLRFAIHYMYTEHSEVRGNESRRNNIGYALMYSRDIRVIGNRSIGDRDHGLMLNYVDRSEIRDNGIRDVRGKCLFFYNANFNEVTGNRFAHCGIGIHFTAGSERNTIITNAFIANRRQVKYVGTRYLDWGAGGRGNYWSDHAGFDLDGDGISDTPYRPNDIVDRILWSQPDAKLLLSSPAFQTLRMVQSQLPPVLVGGVIDSAPLMAPPPLPPFPPAGPRIPLPGTQGEPGT